MRGYDVKKLENIRAEEAKGKIAFYGGETDRHPQGESAKRFLVPYENGKGCWDTHPRGYLRSEWGNLAGMV
jgi:hypothetical protein